MARIVNRKPPTVLIVEDDREMRSLLCDEFCGTGISYVKRGMGTTRFWRSCNPCPI